MAKIKKGTIISFKNKKWAIVEENKKTCKGVSSTLVFYPLLNKEKWVIETIVFTSKRLSFSQILSLDALTEEEKRIFSSLQKKKFTFMLN